MNRRKRPWIIVGSVILIALVGSNMLAYHHAYAMMHFTAGSTRTDKPEELTLSRKIRTLFCGVSIPRPHSDAAPASLGPDCQAIKIPGTNGITLGAWFCAGPARSPLVILFHGYAGEKTGTVPEAKVFLELGASVLLVDFRGSGDSSESYTTVGYDEAQDVAAAVRYAKTQFNPPELILYGQSMGAAALLRAVHSGSVQPDGIIVEGVFDEMLNTVRHRFQAMGIPSFPNAQLLVFWGGRQAGFNAFKHNPVDYARSVRCPILFLHGSADPRARVEEAHRVFEAVPGSKRFAEFPGLGHESAVNRYRTEWTACVNDLMLDAARPKTGKPAGLEIHSPPLQ